MGRFTQMQYMVRVEIHNASRETYDRLHSAMEAESFSRTLTADGTGKKSHMPIGAYWTETSSDAWTVMEAAKRAALPIHAGAEIVVCGGPRLVFYNCPEYVEPRPFASLANLLAPQPNLDFSSGHAFTLPTIGPQTLALRGLADFYRSR